MTLLVVVKQPERNMENDNIPNNTQETPQYLTKDEFGKTAAMIRGLKEENASLKGMLEAIVEKGEDGSYKLKGGAPATPEAKKTAAVPEWQTELNALKTELSKRDALIAEKDKKAAETAKRSAIVEMLSKANAVNPQRDAVHLFDSVQTNSDGKYVAYTKDELGNDVETPLESFVGGWLKSNPELVKASGKPGSGTPNGHSIASYDLDDTDMNAFVKNRGELLKHSKRV